MTRQWVYIYFLISRLICKKSDFWSFWKNVYLLKFFLKNRSIFIILSSILVCSTSIKLKSHYEKINFLIYNANLTKNRYFQNHDHVKKSCLEDRHTKNNVGFVLFSSKYRCLCKNFEKNFRGGHYVEFPGGVTM